MKKLIYIFIITFLWTNISNSDQTYLNLDEINLNKLIHEHLLWKLSENLNKSRVSFHYGTAVVTGS